MEVVAFRMVNGDEILGRLEFESIDKETVTLSKVRHLVVQRTADGLATVLMPWAFSNIDGAVDIKTAHIMAEISPAPENVLSYQEQTTGIALTSA